MHPRVSLKSLFQNPRVLEVILAVIISLYLSGCCYSFSQRGALEGKKLYFTPFINKSSEPGVEDELSRMVLEELSSSFRLVENEKRADILLEGEIITAEEEVYSYTPDEEPKEFKYSIKGRFKLSNSAGKVIFERELEGWGVYLADGGERERAIQTALELLASRLTDLIRSL